MNIKIRNQKICLKEFIPEKILCNNNASKSYDLKILDQRDHFKLTYFVDIYNQIGKVGKKKYFIEIPKFIRRNKETFEVLGLLQAEMGKKLDGKIVFCNHEYQLINKVVKWFDKEFDLPKNRWRWYIKVNINEPLDQEYKKQVEDKVIAHWLEKADLSIEQSYPKKVSYVKNTDNKQLEFYDYGTLIIEKRSNLFSQIIKILVKNIFNNILRYEDDEIRSLMKGIIAGESDVELSKKYGKFRVFVSAKYFEERIYYQKCLDSLNIESTAYPNFHGLVFSNKENLLELLKQKLMTLSPEKYNKFLRMIKLYKNFKGLNVWQNNIRKPWNKTPEHKIKKIIRLYKQNPDWPAWRIAEQVGVSDIKVQRVLKDQGLGRKVFKTPESKRKEIAIFAEENLKLTQKQIAEIFHVHESIVRRAIDAYSIQRGNAARCKIPDEKERIIQIYKENPAAKISDIVQQLGVSDSVVQRVRKEQNLEHLGYKYLIGCNNKKMKKQHEKEQIIKAIEIKQ